MSDDDRKWVENNIRIAFMVACRWKFRDWRQKLQNLDDVKASAVLGFAMAAASQTYDSSLSKRTTYAARAAWNAISIWDRQEKRAKNIGGRRVSCMTDLRGAEWEMLKSIAVEGDFDCGEKDSDTAKAHVDRALSRLPTRYRKIISMRHGIGCEPMTVREIAEVFGCSFQRISQIEIKATERIRHMFPEDFFI